MKNTTFCLWLYGWKRSCYTGHMVHLTKAVQAGVPRSEAAKVVAWVYVAILTVMVVAQLFAFEDFIPLIANYQLPGDYGTASLVGGLIVLFEVFALPLLLRMQLSPLFRWFSLVCSVAAALLWVMLAVVGLSDTSVQNSGLLGSVVTVPGGIVQVGVSLGLVILAGWSVWGLWPRANEARRKAV